MWWPVAVVGTERGVHEGLTCRAGGPVFTDPVFFSVEGQVQL